MKMRLSALRRLIRESYDSFGVGEKDPRRFLHGEDPSDSEGGMVKSKLQSLIKMAGEIHDLLQPMDQLPGWVQDHISVAHENVQQAHGYLSTHETNEPKFRDDSWDGSNSPERVRVGR